MTPAGAKNGNRQSDHALAQKCAAGDATAQREFFHDYRKLVHATLYRIFGSNQDMEDLVQDAFIQIYRSLTRFRGDARLSTWVSRITTRVAYAHLSRRKPEALPLEAVPERASESRVDEQAQGREAVRRLYAALDRVEAKQRIAFALHVVDGRSMKDVAEITGASLVATKSRVWRARREIERRAQRDPVLSVYLTKQGGK